MIPIAREVRVLLIAIGIALIFIQIRFDIHQLWIAWLFYFLLIFLFRDFSRAVPAQPLAIVSPVDGKVIDIEEAYDPYLKRVALCIHMQQTWYGEFNMHSPVEGNIENLWVISPSEPSYRQLAISFQTDEEDEVVVAANLKAFFKHASCSVSTGDRLGQGQRCGFLAFACKLVIYIPPSAHVAIKVGQSVRAGSDKLAEFVHEKH